MVQAVKKQIEGELLLDEPMVRYTTWRVGGPADRLYKPADLADLVLFIQSLDADEPVFWLGLGSNLLVRDGGIRGTVIATQGALNNLELMDDGLVRAEAGVTCAKVARFCSSQSLSEAEFLAGIPGTMGGALAMNAGAFGSETWDYVEAVETLDRQGQLHVRTADEFSIGYRTVTGPENEWFVAARMRLKKNAMRDDIKKSIKQLLVERNASQPIGQPSCGSVFRNPQNNFAAKLIEQTGLKGVCEGGACVSEKHANFIINTGDATAQDIETLIERVSAEVLSSQGVQLETEVRITGELLDTGERGTE